MIKFLLICYFVLNASGQENQPYILVLGTAQDAGYPQINCQNELCKRTHINPGLKRFVTSLAVVDPLTKEFWIFDATPDITEQLQLIKDKTGILTIPTGIFLTHAHIGHYTGLMYFGREVMGSNDLPVYVMPRMKTFLETNGPWSQLVLLKNISLKPIENRSRIKLNERISVEPFLVPHRDEFSETVGYRIIGPDKSVLFIPDIDKWSKWDHSIVDEIKNNNLAFIDGSFYDQNELPGRDMSEIPHPFIVESMNLFRELSSFDRDKVHFIHFNHSNYLLDPKSKQSQSVLEKGFNFAEQGSKVKL